MNWFIIAGGFLWLAGAGVATIEGNYKMAVISVCYAVAQFVLANIKN